MFTIIVSMKYIHRWYRIFLGKKIIKLLKFYKFDFTVESGNDSFYIKVFVYFICLFHTLFNSISVMKAGSLLAIFPGKNHIKIEWNSATKTVLKVVSIFLTAFHLIHVLTDLMKQLTCGYKRTRNVTVSSELIQAAYSVNSGSN